MGSNQVKFQVINKKIKRRGQVKLKDLKEREIKDKTNQNLENQRKMNPLSALRN